MKMLDRKMLAPSLLKIHTSPVDTVTHVCLHEATCSKPRVFLINGFFFNKISISNND